MQRKYLVTIIAVLAVLLVGRTKLDAAVGPVIKDHVHKTKVDPKFQPRLGTYYYTIELNGITIGNASITISDDKDLYRMDFEARTNKAIDRIYKVRYSGQSTMDPDPLSSVETKILQRVRSTNKDISIQFQDNGTIRATEEESKGGKLVDNDVREVRAESLTLDPFSATYLIRSFDWGVGIGHKINIFNGKNIYEWKLTCNDTAVVDIEGRKRTVWVIGQEYRKLDDKDQKEQPKVQSGATLYISADEFKDVLKLEVNRSMGHFYAFLDRFEPAQGSAGEAKVAAGR